MTHGHENQTANTLVIHAGPRDKWSTDLCGCCGQRSCGVCMYSWFLPCCASASARSEYDGSNCCFNLLAVNPTMARNIIRSGYHIEGGACGDIFKNWFALPCSVAQVLHEVRQRGPIRPEGTEPKEWKKGLFNFDLGACAYAWFFPTCAIAEARRRYDGSAFLFNCCCSGPALNRSIIRQGYGLEGNCCTDLLIGCFLPCCNNAQLLQETKKRGRNDGVKPGQHEMK